MIKVSVIVPVYNVEKYIERCLKTLVEQTLENIEIIIVNDGSTDSSKEIIKKYIEQYPLKIKYFEKENGGLSSARNFGLKYTIGEYIAFLDSDDYIEKDMYEEMYKKAIRDKSDMVECDFIWEWEELKQNIKENNLNNGENKEKDYDMDIKEKKDTRKSYKNKREMMKSPRVVVWNKIIKREIIEKHNIVFPEGLIYEDLEFFFKLIPFVNKISYINKYFVHYIQRENSISNTQTEKNRDIFKILDNIMNFYKTNGLYEKYEKELRYMSLRILFGSSLKRILKMKNKKVRRKMLLDTLKNVLKCNRYQMLQKRKKSRFGSKLSRTKTDSVLNFQKLYLV